MSSFCPDVSCTPGPVTGTLRNACRDCKVMWHGDCQQAKKSGVPARYDISNINGMGHSSSQ